MNTGSRLVRGSDCPAHRNIRSIGRLSVVMWVVVLLTVGWVLIAGLANFQLNRVLDFPPNAFNLSWSFFVGLGGATLTAVYDYGGYNNVCFFGGEVKDPGRIIPRTVLLSILAVAAICLTMTITIMGVVRGAKRSIQTRWLTKLSSLISFKGCMAPKPPRS